MNSQETKSKIKSLERTINHSLEEIEVLKHLCKHSDYKVQYDDDKLKITTYECNTCGRVWNNGHGKLSSKQPTLIDEITIPKIKPRIESLNKDIDAAYKEIEKLKRMCKHGDYYTRTHGDCYTRTCNGCGYTWGN